MAGIAVTGVINLEHSVPLQVGPIRPSVGADIGSSLLALGDLGFAQLERSIIIRSSPRARLLKSAGAVSPMFGEIFWFGFVHIVPNSFDLGTVLSGIQRSWEYYNGKSVPVSVTLIEAAAASGFTITEGNLTTPFTVGVGASEVYTVTISADGPDVIAAVYTYTNADADVLTVNFTGQRLVLMSMPADKPIREEWGFHTDILEQMNGTETQRRALRDVGRQRLTYSFLLDEERAAKFDNQIFDWNKRLWALVDQTQFVTLTAPAQAPDVALAVTATADIDFRTGVNESVVLFIDEDTFETAEPGSIAANTITLANGLTSALVFPVGTKVFPVRLGYGAPTISQRQYKTGAREVTFPFTIKNNVDLGDLAGTLPTAYKSLPVFDRLLYTPGATSVPVRFEFGSEGWDPDGIGVFTQATFRESPRITQPVRFYMDDRAEYVAIRKLVHGTKGKQKSFWVSSNRHDFTIQTDQAAGTVLTVNAANYTKHIFSLNSNMRRDIEITYIDGTVDYREITGTTDNSPTNETFTLDTTVSQVLSAANVFRISYLNRCRFGSDNFLFLHTRRDNVVMDTTLVQVEQ